MTLYLDNDTDVIVENLQLADDFSTITDAALAASLCRLGTGNTGTIAGATNASPVVITSAAHGLSTGDQVVITDVEGNPGANGPWTVTVLSSSTFSLDDSAGSGAYISGGVWYRSVPGAHALPLTYSSARRRYRAVIPGTVPLIAGASYRRIITCSNYRLQWETDLTAAKRR